MHRIILLLAAILGLASWLAPNHYPPWVAFHAELLMMSAFALALGSELWLRRAGRWELRPLTLVTLALALVPLAQFMGGLIYFAGDAWLAFAYLLAFALSQTLGQRLTARGSAQALFERLATLFVLASMLCVGLQLYQWLGLTGLGIFAADLPPNARPFANVAQPNHLATMLFLGLVGTLFLFELRRVRGWITTANCAFLMFGLAMTGSRTAWLALTVLLAWLWVARPLAGLRIPRAALVAMGAGFVGFVLGWAPLCDVLLLSEGRTFANQAQAGPRPLLWETMLDALSRQPWLGYGWNQGLVAQSRVVDAHPAGGRLIESSHNLLLDLLVWNGIPLGLMLAGFLIWWFWKHIQISRDPARVYLMAAIGGVFVHAMVEYPLSYAYFLLPVGLMMGAVDAGSVTRHALKVPRTVMAALACVSAALLATITAEYVQIEPNNRLLRFELAHIGTVGIDSEAPDLVLLTQWREYLRFVRVEAHPGMSAAELAWMREVAERYPYAPAQFRYALANGLNAHPDLAHDTLIRLCKLQTVQRCRESLQAWRELAQSQYPQLADVPLLPPS